MRYQYSGAFEQMPFLNYIFLYLPTSFRSCFFYSSWIFCFLSSHSLISDSFSFLFYFFNLPPPLFLFIDLLPLYFFPIFFHFFLFLFFSLFLFIFYSLFVLFSPSFSFGSFYLLLYLLLFLSVFFSSSYALYFSVSTSFPYSSSPRRSPFFPLLLSFSFPLISIFYYLPLLLHVLPSPLPFRYFSRADRGLNV